MDSGFPILPMDKIWLIFGLPGSFFGLKKINLRKDTFFSKQSNVGFTGQQKKCQEHVDASFASQHLGEKDKLQDELTKY